MDQQELIRLHIGFSLKHAYFAERTAIDNALREMRLTASQWAVLRCLSHRGSVSNAELSRIFSCTPQSMWETVGHLEREGLVERVRHPNNATVMPLHLTAAGRRAMEEADQVVFGIEEQMLRGFSPEEKAQLRKLLDRCVDNLDYYCSVAKEMIDSLETAPTT